MLKYSKNYQRNEVVKMIKLLTNRSFTNYLTSQHLLIKQKTIESFNFLQTKFSLASFYTDKLIIDMSLKCFQILLPCTPQKSRFSQKQFKKLLRKVVKVVSKMVLLMCSIFALRSLLLLRELRIEKPFQNQNERRESII